MVQGRSDSVVRVPASRGVDDPGQGYAKHAVHGMIEVYSAELLCTCVT